MNGSTADERNAILDAIRELVAEIGEKRPTKKKLFERLGKRGILWRKVEHIFPTETVTSVLVAAGCPFGRYHAKIPLEEWLKDWGEVVRRKGGIPTLKEYKHKAHGAKYSPGVFENDPNGGKWILVPLKFREFAQNKSEWTDVVAKLPIPKTSIPEAKGRCSENLGPATPKYSRIENRPTYGNPINFRGLRHEPVNEQGVVFLFGMVAKELGYMVEAVQVGFPDCEAKRQVEGGRWQSVKIEFEFESRNYNHPADGCDVIVCWRHNWPDCPLNIKVVEFSDVISSLA